MQLNSSFQPCDDMALTHPALPSMSVKAFLKPFTLYPFQQSFVNFSKRSTQFKRLQFFPIHVKNRLDGLMWPKNAYSTVASESLVRQSQDFTHASTRTNWLIRRFLQPVQWLTSSKKSAGAMAMAMALPIAYVASTFDFGSSGFSNKRLTTSNVFATPSMATFDSIIAQKQLRLATVNDSTTYFAEDGFEHGFGYDVVRNYAQRLNVGVTTQVFASEAEAIAAVKAGKADIALTNLNNAQALSDANLSAQSLTCNQDYVSQHDLNKNIAMQFNNADAKLNSDIKNFLCNGQSLATNQHLAAFYSHNVMAESFNQAHFIDTMTHVLPMYEASFKQTAKQYDLDWELLVAMGYQESHLDAEATSPTDVRGIMMLTNATADAMGVNNRTDPTQSIQGGAKYLKILQDEFEHVPASDRIWFTLAAYNMGPQAVKNIQEILNKRGRDGNNWAQVYQYLKVNSTSNSRFGQCLDYVTHIRGYLEALKLDAVTTRQFA